MDLLTRAVLLGGCLPAAAGGAAAFAAGRHPRARGWAAAAGTAAGYVSGQAALAGWPRLPPADTTGMLFLLALVAGVLGGFGSRPEATRFERLAAAVFLAAAATVAALHPGYGRWTLGTAALWTGGAAGTGLLLQAAGRRAAGKLPPGEWLLLHTMTLAAVAGGLLFGFSALLSQLAGGLAAAVAGTWVLGLRAPAAAPGGAAAVIATLVPALLLNGVLWAYLPLEAALLLLLSALGPVAGTLGRPGPRVPLRRWASLLATVLPAVAGLWIARAHWLAQGGGSDLYGG